MADNPKKFSVVQFKKENSFAAVPAKWIFEEGEKLKCKWPQGTQILNLIKNPNSQPKSTWKKLEIKLFRSLCSDDYDIANANVDEARVLSGGETETQSGSESKDSEKEGDIDGTRTDVPPSKSSPIAVPSTSFNNTLDFAEEVLAGVNEANLFSFERNHSEVVAPLVIQTVNSEADKLFQKTVLDALTKLQTEIDLISAKLGSLVASQDTAEGIENAFSFPLLTDGDVDNFEQKLDDSTARKLLVVDLIKIGGLNVQGTTSRILSHIFGQPIAEKTSKTGKGEGNTYGFLKLKCSSLIIGAVLRNPRCAGTTAKDVELSAEKWFNGAKDRGGGRERRRKTKGPVQENPTDSN